MPNRKKKIIHENSIYLQNNGQSKSQIGPNRNSLIQEGILEYIEIMTAQLSSIAKDQGQGFLAHLLNLAVLEAQSAKTRVFWDHEQPQK